jgi:hypothetical protein
LKKLITRDEFRESVFARDQYKCVYCGKKAVDAHHILDRSLFADGGYYIDNGASLCEDCHIEAEKCFITVEELRKLAGITTIILPDGFDEKIIYDKWGNTVESSGKYLKYPRTYHLPWSEKATDDDKILKDISQFAKREIVQTVKLDGENTTMYRDHFHARSLDSKHHPSRNWVKGLWASIAYEIPEGWRICGENVYAVHTIEYSNLATYFYVYSIWNEKNEALSWDETLEYCELLNLTPVPVLYRGIFDEDKIRSQYQPVINGDRCEGYVIRLADSFKYEDFTKSVAKFVSTSFEIAGNEHWSHKKVTPNKLSKNSN